VKNERGRIDLNLLSATVNRQENSGYDENNDDDDDDGNDNNNNGDDDDNDDDNDDNGDHDYDVCMYVAWLVKHQLLSFRHN
jgi:hypothetical protein